MKPSTNPDNGMITGVWGPPLWTALHCISLNYPRRPTEADKEAYLQFFRSLKDVLPCGACRKSYATFIAPRGATPLNLGTMKSRRTVSKWLYDVHNQVNERLKKPRGPPYSTITKRYERFRASDCKPEIHGCVGRGKLKLRSKVVIKLCKR